MSYKRSLRCKIFSIAPSDRSGPPLRSSIHEMIAQPDPWASSCLLVSLRVGFMPNSLRSHRTQLTISISRPEFRFPFGPRAVAGSGFRRYAEAAIENAAGNGLQLRNRSQSTARSLSFAMLSLIAARKNRSACPSDKSTANGSASRDTASHAVLAGGQSLHPVNTSARNSNVRASGLRSLLRSITAPLRQVEPRCRRCLPPDPPRSAPMRPAPAAFRRQNHDVDTPRRYRHPCRSHGSKRPL